MLRDYPLVTAFERSPLRTVALGYVAPSADIVAASLVCSSMRHGCLDRRAYGFKIVGKIRCDETRSHRRHPATDINAYSGGNYGSLGGDHRADRSADSHMHIGHRGNPSIDEG